MNKHEFMKQEIKSALKYLFGDLKMFFIQFFACVGAMYVVVMVPEICHASLESSLDNMKSKLTGFILPCMAVIGMAGAALSFFVGHENAKKHAICAAVGCVIGFGAQAIVDFISQTVV